VTIALRDDAPAALSGGPRFVSFCGRYIRQTIGRWADRLLILEPWEVAFWNEALEIDPESGKRIYTEVGLGLPTKNGKSTQASAAGLYFLIADGEAEPEVIIAAAARPQARIVFGAARRMAGASPLILDRVKVGQHWIEVPRTGGIMRPVSADAPLQHGVNPSANIIDEIHAHRNGDLYTALTKSGAAREQPFTFWITTAGGRDEGLLAELYGQMFTGDGALEERPGLTIYRDRRNGILIYWYGAAKDADIEDPAVWSLVNPASWMTEGTWLRGEFARLKARGSLLEWRLYHLNQMVDRVDSWLPLLAWRDASAPEHELDPLLPIGVGAYKTPDGSLGAVVVAQRQGERVVVRAWHYSPEASTGQASPLAIRARLAELRAAFPAPMTGDPKTKAPLMGPAVAYASYNLEESATMLAEEGVNMVKFPLYAGTMGPASTVTHELIVTGRLVHDGDLILTEHISRTSALLTDRGMQIVAGKAPLYNPSAIALAAAVAMATLPPPPPPPKPVSKRMISW
jgi:phage terminase large subunit-like protein